MFKMLFTLARGASVAAAEDFKDRNALILLDQQVRDASSALDRAKKSLALAIAQGRQEAARLSAIGAQIADLETRTSAALAAGDEAAARCGVEAIAMLENDRDAATTARALFSEEIQRLRAYAAQAETRIAALDRGRRIARAAESVGRLRAGRIEPGAATLAEAEATLNWLRVRQTEAQATEDALDEIENAVAPARVAEQLAAAGFGPKLRASADDVLARLKAKTAAPVQN